VTGHTYTCNMVACITLKLPFAGTNLTFNSNCDTKCNTNGRAHLLTVLPRGRAVLPGTFQLEHAVHLR
jgi:hypothetical protein